MVARTSVQVPDVKITELHSTDKRQLLLTPKLTKALNPSLGHHEKGAAS